jgi:hypothetical protein
MSSGMASLGASDVDLFRSNIYHNRIPATFIITGFLVGIDELALQLEEPFTVLPQHAITANSIGKVVTESVDWRKTDYERMVDASSHKNGSL